MSKFILLCGAPASGKSTWSENFSLEGEKQEEKVCIVSSDSIRGELWGDESIQDNPSKVFEIAHNRIIDALNSDFDYVIFDATNVKRKDRMSIMNKINLFSCEKRCVVFVEPWSVLFNRNNLRERRVPESVIWKMIKNFETPLYTEGYDSIDIICNNYINVSEYVGYMKDFNQENSHHSLSLSEHCEKTGEYILSKVGENNYHFEPCVIAGFLHDIGKVFTKSFIDYKGEPTDDAHYYGHSNVGAYLCLLFESSWCRSIRLMISQLVCYHMQPYFNKSPDSKNKWRKIWGEELNNFILLLNEADRYAH